MGQCNPAAMTARAIPAHHTGRKEPVCSMARPPSQTPRKAPTWWLKNTIPKRVPRLLVPNITATSPEVSGTVESQRTPIAAAKTSTTAGVGGRVMKRR